MSVQDQFVVICVGLFVLVLLVPTEPTTHGKVQRIVLAAVCIFWLSSVVTHFLHG